MHQQALMVGMVKTAAKVIPKMVKGDIKPFMMAVEKAADHLEFCIKKRPVSYTAPKFIMPLIKFRKLMMKL